LPLEKGAHLEVQELSGTQLRSIKRLLARVEKPRAFAVFRGNCRSLLPHISNDSVDITITSPPYCIGKAYESESTTTEDFIRAQKEVLPEIVRVTKPGGSICWQIGYHVTDGSVFPLDYAIYDVLRDYREITLRNRIIWTFGHGLHSTARFSGRHETVLWFTKGDSYKFHLDAIRIPQKYPGKRHYKGSKKGEFSGNPLGKNPGDVWEMPNVKANHVEKTEHPCQFPIALAQRLIRALTPDGGLVFDPFLGVGSTGAAAVIENRRFLGAELSPTYAEISVKRLEQAKTGAIRYRTADKPIHVPRPTDSVAKRPEHFKAEFTNGV
jgi:adenine-specific DNA-methyltransferase